jgi:hypothetical protein
MSLFSQPISNKSKKNITRRSKNSKNVDIFSTLQETRIKQTVKNWVDGSLDSENWCVEVTAVQKEVQLNVVVAETLE